MMSHVILDELMSLKSYCEANGLTYGRVRRAAAKAEDAGDDTFQTLGIIKVAGRWLTSESADADAIAEALPEKGARRTSKYDERRWALYADEDAVKALVEFASEHGVELEIVDLAKRRENRKAAKEYLAERGHTSIPDGFGSYEDAAKDMGWEPVHESETV